MDQQDLTEKSPLLLQPELCKHTHTSLPYTMKILGQNPQSCYAQHQLAARMLPPLCLRGRGDPLHFTDKMDGEPS